MSYSERSGYPFPCFRLENLDGIGLDAAAHARAGRDHDSYEDRDLFPRLPNPPEECPWDMRTAADGFVFGVFDGCGGTDGAALAASRCRDRLGAVVGQPPQSTDLPRIRRFAQAMEEANLSVWEEQRSNPAVSMMACAATAAWLWWPDGRPGEVAGCLVHVGDTVAYHIRGKDIVQLTDNHKNGLVLTQVVGMDPARFRCQARSLDLALGDILLLATDGLVKGRPMTPAELHAFVVRECKSDPLRIVPKWIELMTQRGSRDDKTAIAIRLC